MMKVWDRARKPEETRSEMEPVRPFLKCVDYWPGKIPPLHLAAYKAMISKGQILKQHVIYNRATGSTTVEYYSTVPHEWIRQEMKKIVKELEHEALHPTLE